MKHKRQKPRATVERNRIVTPVDMYDVPLECISIREWGPDLEGKEPSEQVHFVLVIGKSDEKMELGLRFESPDTLGFLIEELIAYRKSVWREAEPINPDAEMEDVIT